VQEAIALLASMPVEAVPPVTSDLPPGSRVMFSPNALFRGRDRDLLGLAERLKGDGTAPAPAVVSRGIGGVGKTQLAAEFVHRFGGYFAGGVYWLTFDAPHQVSAQVAECAGPSLMALVSSLDDVRADQLVGLVVRAWQDGLPRLLVFDNCEDEELFELWKPVVGRCSVLVTSRRSGWTRTLGVVEMPVVALAREDSIGLLRSYDAGNHLLPTQDLDAIARVVGDLPLALHLAGSFLAAYASDISPRQYLAELERDGIVMHSSLRGQGLEDAASPTRHVQSVLATFAISLRRLSPNVERDNRAIALLETLGCFAPGEPIPRWILRVAVSNQSRMQIASGLNRLSSLGLVQTSNDSIYLHRLIVSCIRLSGTNQGTREAVDRALIQAGEAARRGELEGVPLGAVLPHLLHAASEASSLVGQRFEIAGRLELAAGVALERTGDYKAASKHAEESLIIREQFLGRDDPLTLEAVRTLGRMRHQTGDYLAAFKLHRRAFKGRSHQLGQGASETAESLHDVGSVLLDLGKLRLARPRLERALEVRKRLLGSDDPDTAATLNILATLYRELGDSAKAIVFIRQALEIRNRVLGSEHSDTLVSRSNLAVLLKDTGDLAGAWHHYEEVFKIRVRVLGLDHPKTASVLNNRGNLLAALGNYVGAKSDLEQAVRSRQRTLGPDHLETLATMSNLAKVLHLHGGLDEIAMALFESALAGKLETAGPAHLSTASTLDHFADLMEDVGLLARAWQLRTQSVSVYERALGVNHPRVGSALARLGGVALKLGDRDEACRLYSRALRIISQHSRPDEAEVTAIRERLEGCDDRGSPSSDRIPIL
jgi:tetratricopeptide (TPR) repeat protein